MMANAFILDPKFVKVSREWRARDESGRGMSDGDVGLYNHAEKEGIAPIKLLINPIKSL
jgi:hypothetical protein